MPPGRLRLHARTARTAAGVAVAGRPPRRVRARSQPVRARHCHRQGRAADRRRRAGERLRHAVAVAGADGRAGRDRRCGRHAGAGRVLVTGFDAAGDLSHEHPRRVPPGKPAVRAEGPVAPAHVPLHLSAAGRTAAHGAARRVPAGADGPARRGRHAAAGGPELGLGRAGLQLVRRRPPRALPLPGSRREVHRAARDRCRERPADLPSSRSASAGSGASSTAAGSSSGRPNAAAGTSCTCTTLPVAASFAASPRATGWCARSCSWTTRSARSTSWPPACRPARIPTRRGSTASRWTAAKCSC